MTTAATTMLRCYEITLNGYYGGTDKTDALVKWVAAPSDEAIAAFVRKYDLGAIIQDGPHYMQGRDYDGVEELFAEGVDLLIDHNGSVVRWCKQLNLRWAQTWANEAWPQPFVEEVALAENRAVPEFADLEDATIVSRVHKRLAKKHGYRRVKK